MVFNREVVRKFIYQHDKNGMQQVKIRIASSEVNNTCLRIFEKPSTTNLFVRARWPILIISIIIIYLKGLVGLKVVCEKGVDLGVGMDPNPSGD